MMDTTDHDHNESEASPFQEICELHGAKVLRHHGCPKCVMEEVRRHEQRIHVPLELDAPLELEPDAPIEVEQESAIEIEHDAPIPTDPLGNIDPLAIEII